MSHRQPDKMIGGVDELDVVLCGALRPGVKSALDSYKQLKVAGFNVLSPRKQDVTRSTKDNTELHERQLNLIPRARLVWLHAPERKVDPITAAEIGFAIANRIPVYSSSRVEEPAFRGLLSITTSPSDLAQQVRACKVPPPAPAVTVFQHYYRKAMLQRSPGKETPAEILLAMAEVFGNLSRAIRKEEGLVRHGAAIKDSAPQELAALFLECIRLANRLTLDLGQVVQEKELRNIRKLLRRK